MDQTPLAWLFELWHAVGLTLSSDRAAKVVGHDAVCQHLPWPSLADARRLSYAGLDNARVLTQPSHPVTAGSEDSPATCCRA